MKKFFRSYYEAIMSSKQKIVIKKELFRKSIHFCAAFVPLLLLLNKFLILLLLACAIVAYSVAEILRLRGFNVPFISDITDMASRGRDKNNFVLGPVTLAIGVFITALVFPYKEATIGIFALAFGDGIAGLAGTMFGHIKIPFTKGKSVAGSLCCFLAVFISTLFIIPNVLFSVIIALGAMLLEMIPLRDYDNVLIPIATAFLAVLLPQVIRV